MKVEGFPVAWMSCKEAYVLLICHFWSNKKYFFSICIFKKNFVIKTPDPYPDSIEMLEPDPNSLNLDPQHYVWYRTACGKYWFFPSSYLRHLIGTVRYQYLPARYR